jgi:hypothetical protein
MKTGKVHPQGNSSRRFEASRRNARREASPASDDCGWRLPSGMALAEYVLRAGCVAPVLLGWEARGAQGGRKHSLKSKSKEAAKAEMFR